MKYLIRKGRLGQAFCRSGETLAQSAGRGLFKKSSLKAALDGCEVEKSEAQKICAAFNLDFNKSAKAIWNFEWE